MDSSPTSLLRALRLRFGLYHCKQKGGNGGRERGDSSTHSFTTFCTTAAIFHLCRLCTRNTRGRMRRGPVRADSGHRSPWNLPIRFEDGACVMWPPRSSSRSRKREGNYTHALPAVGDCRAQRTRRRKGGRLQKFHSRVLRMRHVRDRGRMREKLLDRELNFRFNIL